MKETKDAQIVYLQGFIDITGHKSARLSYRTLSSNLTVFKTYTTSFNIDILLGNPVYFRRYICFKKCITLINIMFYILNIIKQ